MTGPPDPDPDPDPAPRSALMGSSMVERVREEREEVGGRVERASTRVLV